MDDTVGLLTFCKTGPMFKRFDRPVRGSAGHLYTSIWIPFGSLKGLSLGWRRVQYCPVGKHWALTSGVKTGSVDPVEIQAAGKIHDIKIP